MHLRVCRSCGHVACCDSSPNQHASKHAAASGHPIVSSLEPGEDWSWCYVDEVAFVVESPRLMALWIFEPGHTAIEFRARHMMVTWVRGHLGGGTSQASSST